MFSEVSNTPHNRDTNKKLVKIIHSLLQSEQSAPFRKPVPHKALGLGDYKKIIKKPIDLNQIRRQNNQSKYKTIEEALDDIELCWDNCKLYNHASSQVYQQAISLQRAFWKMVQDNFPDIYTAVEPKLRQIQTNQPANTMPRAQKNVPDQIYEASQSEPVMIDQKQEAGQQLSSNKNGEGDQQESRNSKMDEQINDSGNQQNNDRSQRSQQKEQIKEPIQVYLKQKPSADNIAKLTAHMKTIQDKSILEQVLQILFTHQKENMISSTKGSMYFKIQNIHLSTFYRICRVIKLEVDDMLQVIQ